MIVETVTSRIEGIDGWLTPYEATLLYQLAAVCPQGSNIVEIGSYHGRSTIALALGARESGATVYAVDPHDPYTVDGAAFGAADNAVFMRNILNAGVADVVKVINLSSVDFAAAWHKPIALLFIDGNHEGNAPFIDYMLYAGNVQQAQGKIAFHDSQGAYKQPTEVVQQAVENGYMRVSQIVDQITVLEF